TPLGSDRDTYLQPVLRDRGNKTATERCKNPATKRTKPQPHLPMPGDPTEEDRRAPCSACGTSAVLESTQNVRQQNHGIRGDAGRGPVGLRWVLHLVGESRSLLGQPPQLLIG